MTKKQLHKLRVEILKKYGKALDLNRADVCELVDLVSWGQITAEELIYKLENDLAAA